MWRHGLGWAVREKCLKSECLNAVSTFQQKFGLAAVCLVLPIQLAACCLSSKMTFSRKEKLVALQQMGNGSGELGFYPSPESQGEAVACILNWWFVLAMLGAPWMAWAPCDCQTGSWHGRLCLMVTLEISSSCPGIS